MAVANEAKDAASFIEDDTTESIISQYTPSQTVDDDAKVSKESKIIAETRLQAQTEDWRHDTKLLRAEKRILELEMQLMKYKNTTNETEKLQYRLQNLETKFDEYGANSMGGWKDLRLAMQDILVDKVAAMKRTKESMVAKQSHLESLQRELEEKNGWIAKLNTKVHDLRILLREHDSEVANLKNSIDNLDEENKMLHRRNKSLTKKNRDLENRTESWTQYKSRVRSDLKALEVKHEKAEKNIVEFKRFTSVMITKIDLAAQNWRIWVRQDMNKDRQMVNLTLSMFRFMVQQNDPEYLAMYEGYRRYLIEKHEKGQACGHIYTKWGMDIDGQLVYRVPTGDEFRKLFQNEDEKRNQIIDHYRNNRGISLGHVGNYAVWE